MPEHTPRFTPGPWTHHWNERNKRTHSGEWIFTAPNLSFPGHTVNVWLRGKTGESQANARLVAAAPDLFEACQKALALIEANAPDGYHTEHPHLGVIRAAISKALGEEKPNA